MVRKLEVVVPFKHFGEIRDVLVMNRSVHHLSYRKCITTNESHTGKQYESVIFSFMVVNKKTHELIDLLTMYGVSSRFGTLNVSALTSTKPRVATIKEIRSEDEEYNASTSSLKINKKKRKYKISDRLAYDEVYDTIDNQLHLTFDYLMLIFIGGVIASIGLLTNSAVAVVASMLVSPLMGPIVGMTFGFIIKDNVMLWKSFRNELIGVFVCFLTGAIMGFITAPIMDTPRDTQLAFGENTQISSRGEWISLAWGAGIAAPSGIGVALGVSSDQVSALIGVAISAALLPPIVNSGCCLASALVYFIDPRYDDQVVQKWWTIGYISMLLFLLNWILIFIFGIITFRAKKLHQNANEQIKMDRLNKFYEMRDKMKMEQKQEMQLSINDNNDTIKSNLRTPLLSTISAMHHSDNNNDDDIKPINNELNNNKLLIESMDVIPNMLTSLSNINNDNNNININDKDEINDMINWDNNNKIKQRHNRGMSENIPQKTKPIYIKNNDAGFTQKRLLKRSSLDTYNVNLIKNNNSKLIGKDTNLPSDDIV